MTWCVEGWFSLRSTHISSTTLQNSLSLIINIYDHPPSLQLHDPPERVLQILPILGDTVHLVDPLEQSIALLDHPLEGLLVLRRTLHRRGHLIKDHPAMDFGYAAGVHLEVLDPVHQVVGGVVQLEHPAQDWLVFLEAFVG